MAYRPRQSNVQTNILHGNVCFTNPYYLCMNISYQLSKLNKDSLLFLPKLVAQMGNFDFFVCAYPCPILYQFCLLYSVLFIYLKLHCKNMAVFLFNFFGLRLSCTICRFWLSFTMVFKLSICTESFWGYYHMTTTKCE